MSEITDAREGTFTERGWPRPIVNGWPIPWVSPVENLRRTHPDRMEEVVEWCKCQVCGHEHEMEDDVYVLVNGELGPVPDDLATGKVVQAMDQAVMHERCMRLATGRCPQLRSLKASDNLFIFKSKRKHVMIYDVPEEHRDEGGEERILGIDGEYVELVT